MISKMISLRMSLEGMLDIADEGSSDYRIARYLLENCYVADHVSINDVASHCFVSKSTVSRFCRSIGFDDYQDLNQALVQAYVRADTVKFDRYAFGASPNVAYLDDVAACVEQARTVIREEDVDRVAQDLHAHERVGILGRLQSWSVATDLQHDLLVSHKVSVAPLPVEAQRSFIEGSRDDTFLLVISCSGNYLAGFSRSPVLAGDKPRLCLLTNNPRVAGDSNYDYVVALPCEATYAARPLLLRLFCNLVAIRYAQIA